MRHAYSLYFCLLLLALFARRAYSSYSYSTQFTFSSDYPLCYNYVGVPTAGTPMGTPLLKNEVIMAVLVRDTRSDKTTDPFVIDAAGQVVAAAGLPTDQVVVCDLYAASGTPQHQSWRVIGETAGLPETPFVVSNSDSEEKHSVFSASSATAVAGDDYSAGTYQPVYIYLVVLDTRDSEVGTAVGSPKRVARYALRRCEDVTEEPFGPSYEVFVGKEVEGYTVVGLPGLEVQTNEAGETVAEDGWKDAVAIQSWTKEGGTVLTGADLEAFLKPKFVEATDGTAPFVLSETTATLLASSEAEDITYYTLYTKQALSDEGWIPFNMLMAEKKTELQEKGLDNYLQKDYTRCRLNGGDPLTIPLIPGETGRFYLFRTTGNE